MRTTSLASIALAAAVVGLVAILGGEPPVSRTVVVDGSAVKLTVADLRARADVIAIVIPTGEETVHWNSSRNVDWGDGSPGSSSVIVRDVDVSVEQVLRGELPAKASIRSLGGTVGDVTWVIEDGEHLRGGQPNLVFLRWADMPTEQGLESALIVVGLAQGAFHWDGSLWRNSRTGEALDVAALEE